MYAPALFGTPFTVIVPFPVNPVESRSSNAGPASIVMLCPFKFRLCVIAMLWLCAGIVNVRSDPRTTPFSVPPVRLSAPPAPCDNVAFEIVAFDRLPPDICSVPASTSTVPAVSTSDTDSVAFAPFNVTASTVIGELKATVYAGPAAAIDASYVVPVTLFGTVGFVDQSAAVVQFPVVAETHVACVCAARAADAISIAPTAAHESPLVPRRTQLDTFEMRIQKSPPESHRRQFRNALWRSPSRCPNITPIITRSNEISSHISLFIAPPHATTDSLVWIS